MSDDDAMLNSPVVYSEEEVLAEFQESCERPRSLGKTQKDFKQVAADLCQMQSRNKPQSDP